jgi:hypothetical protein
MEAGAEIAVVSLPFVIETEGFAREHRAVGGEKPTAIVPDGEGAVVDKEFGDAGEEHERDEQQKRPVTAPERAEAPEFFTGDRIGAEGHRTENAKNRKREKRETEGGIS